MSKLLNDNPTWANIINTRKLHGPLTCAQYNASYKIKCNEIECLKLASCFVESDDEETHKRRLVVEANIIEEHDSYVRENYESKRFRLNEEILKLVAKVWKGIRLPLLSLPYLDVLSMTVTFAEFWGIMERIFFNEHKSLGVYMTKSLIEEFIRVFELIKECEKRGKVEFCEFAELFKLRDEMVACVQQVYRVKYPLIYGAKFSEPKNYKNALYLPYDIDWLANVKSTWSLETSKVIHQGRINQLDFYKERLHIVHITDMKNLPKEVPYEPVFSSHSRREDLIVEESVKRQKLKKTLDYHISVFPKHRNLRELETHLNFMERRAEFRRKKSNIFHRLNNNDVDDKENFALQHIVAVVVVGEAHLLFLERVFASYADEKLGIFGPRLPERILGCLTYMFLNSTANFCQHFPLEGEQVMYMNHLRHETITSVREFYMEQEHELEKRFRNPVDLSKDAFAFTEEFPSVMEPWASQIARSQQIEKKEIERLRKELAIAEKINGVKRNPAFAICKFPDGPFVYASNIRKLNLETRAAKVSPQVYKSWKAISTCFDKADAVVVKFVKHHTRVFVFEHCPNLRKQLKDAVVVSFAAAVLDHFVVYEVTYSRIVDTDRAHQRLMTILDYLEDMFAEINSKGATNLDIDYKKYVMLYSNTLKTHSRRKPVPESKRRDGYISDADMLSVAANFISYLLTCKDVLSG